MEPEQLNFGRRLAYVDRTDRTPGEPCAGKKKTGGGISDKQKGCRRGQGAGRSIEAGGLREPFCTAGGGQAAAAAYRWQKAQKIKLLVRTGLIC